MLNENCNACIEALNKSNYMQLIEINVRALFSL